MRKKTSFIEIFKWKGEMFCRAKETDDGKRVLAKHEELLQLLNNFAKSIFSDWSKDVGQASNFNLKQHLITRNPETHLITTNFDAQVMKIRCPKENILTIFSNFLAYRCST